MVYTMAIGFTNYSSRNLLEFPRAGGIVSSWDFQLVKLHQNQTRLDRVFQGLLWAMFAIGVLPAVTFTCATANVTGLVMTKLDGTARGGILVAIAERYGIPINAIGIGEGIDDLEPFDAEGFARAIAGLEAPNEQAA